MKRLFENWRGYLSEPTLYHGTSDVHKDDILRNGIGKSYWGTAEVAEYYAEVTVDEVGGDMIVISKPLSSFKEDLLEPDSNSIAEPLTYTLRKSEDQIASEWEESEGTWQDSLKIVESVIYNGRVEVSEGEIG